VEILHKELSNHKFVFFQKLAIRNSIESSRRTMEVTQKTRGRGNICCKRIPNCYRRISWRHWLALLGVNMFCLFLCIDRIERIEEKLGDVVFFHLILGFVIICLTWVRALLGSTISLRLKAVCNKCWSNETRPLRSG